MEQRPPQMDLKQDLNNTLWRSSLTTGRGACFQKVRTCALSRTPPGEATTSEASPGGKQAAGQGVHDLPGRQLCSGLESSSVPCPAAGLQEPLGSQCMGAWLPAWYELGFRSRK